MPRHLDSSPQLVSDKVKVLRFFRWIFFVLLYTVIVEVLRSQLPVNEWKTLIEQSYPHLVLLVAAMIMIGMLLVYLGGMNIGIGTDLGWKEQLLSMLAFYWSMGAGASLGYLLARTFVPSTENEGVIVLFLFLGMICIGPFQWIAMTAYGKRKGIPMWPNLPKA